MTSKILIVGAGIAGLSCARVLDEAGQPPMVLERSRGVGGRCATRRVEGRPVDHGISFFHGTDPEFLEELRSVTHASVLPDWPIRRIGNGVPCQSNVFRRKEPRLAFAEGVSAYPKHLAQNLDVKTCTRVVSLRIDNDGLRVGGAGGSHWTSTTVVLALATEQSRDLLKGLIGTSSEIGTAEELLGMVQSLPCLTVLAGYAQTVATPDWDVAYPERSDILQLVAHDSRKRIEEQPVVLVAQARPRWSRRNMDRPPDEWRDAIKNELGRLFGTWAAHPTWAQAHRWRYARVDRGSELSAPLLLHLPGGARLGIAGEFFAPGGGLQAAWSSGRKLARRLIEETTP
jgi:predicted NAD/FAD-dependent oxidoreductase